VVPFDKGARSDAAQLAQPRPVPAEDRARQLGQREHVLPVRHRREHVLLDPIAVQQDALLVADGAEVARLARVGEQELVPAGRRLPA